MSLRTRLLVGIVVVAAVLGLVTVRVTRTTRTDLVKQVDQQLERAVPRLADLGVPNSPPGGPAQGTPPGSLYVAVLVRGQLRTIYKPQLTEAEPAAPDLTAGVVTTHLGEAPFTVGSVGSKLRYRVQVRDDGRQGRTVVYALPLENVDRTVRRLIAVQALGAAVILAVLGLVAFWVLRLGVRPVKQMTATATAIADGDLSHRIPDARSGTEAGELGLALNHMLGRIEEAFAYRAASESRLRQFVADASHELRTPLTTIRGYAELYRVGGLHDSDDLDDAMRRTEAEAVRMGSLVEDLLSLARLDQGRPLELSSVHLVAVLNDAAMDSKVVDPSRPLTVEASGDPTLVGDEDRIRQVIANLVDNARAHTPPGTPVVLRARGDLAQVVIEVADAGPGMSPEHAERAFERFYRADPARARDSGGSGLGLSIVAAVAHAHGGQVSMQTSPGEGTTVRVTLPTVPSNTAGAETA